MHLMMGGPVPEHVLSFIGAALSSNTVGRMAATPQVSGLASSLRNTGSSRGEPGAVARHTKDSPKGPLSWRSALHAPHAAAALRLFTDLLPCLPCLCQQGRSQIRSAVSSPRSPGSSAKRPGSAPLRRSASRAAVSPGMHDCDGQHSMTCMESTAWHAGFGA